MSTPAFDPRQYKALQRHEWGVSAAGWQQHWAIWERAAQHVNVRLIELAHVDASHRVLDIATGLGEPAFTAARSPFDVLGAITLPVILTVTVGLLMLTTHGRMSLGLVVGVPMVMMIALVFLWWELKHPDPVLQPRLFRRRAFAAANGGIALGNFAMYTVLLAVPLLVASRRESSTLQGGLVLTALTAAMIVVSPLSGRLADRFGRRLPTIAGLALLTLGAVPMAVAGAEIRLPPLIVGLAFVGAGIGIAMPGLQSTAVESVSGEEAGVASGIYSTSRYLGEHRWVGHARRARGHWLRRRGRSWRCVRHRAYGGSIGNGRWSRIARPPGGPCCRGER
jgi:hypothetical protein